MENLPPRPDSGTVELRTGPFLYAIPQKPYALPSGTLRDQVSYPTGNDGQGMLVAWSPPILVCQQCSGVYAVLQALLLSPCIPIHDTNCLSPDDAYVRECLEQAGLHGLLSRMGGIDCYMEGWATTLSPGEVQRLCFARLFFHRPTLAGVIPASYLSRYFAGSVAL
jgi:ABC-type uncharacterized transport system fused permease/ATPase subunit